MHTKPRPGELVRDYVERCAAELLRRAGASEAEVADFAEVLVLRTPWAGVRTFAGWTPADAREHLRGWRAEKRLVAGHVRRERRARLDAGYFGCPVEDPVYVSGVTPW